MTAIITDKFKIDLFDKIIRDIRQSSVPYYIGVGRSEYWNPADSAPDPRNTISDENDVRRSLQSVARVNATSFVVPRYTWTTGTTYEQYDDTKTFNDYSGSAFYVINDNYNVYICLRTGRDSSGAKVPSTVQPTFANNDPFELSDGYVWKFLYTISNLEATYYMSQNYMPVKIQESVDSNSTGIELKQWEIQQTAKPNMITAFSVDSGGLNYTAPSLSINSIVADPQFVEFTVDSSNGAIVKVEYATDSSTLEYRHGFLGVVAEVSDSNGSDAVIRPILSGNRGIGADARDDLKTRAVMLNVKLASGVEDFVTGQDYRQIVIMRGIKDSAEGSDFLLGTGNALYSMTFSSNPIAFTKDNTIVGTSSGARALVDNTSEDGLTLYYHQNDSTGYVPFSVGETVNELGGSGTGVIVDPRVKPEVDPFSGDILYIDNRASIERVDNQTEDLKIILELENFITTSA